MNDKLYLPPALRLISENILKHGNPLGLSSKDIAAWSRGLKLPGRGKTILYTGGEYQMTSRIQSLVEVLKRVKFEDNALAAFRGLQSVTGRLGVGLMKTFTQVAGADNETYNRILRMAAQVLKRLGVDFAYIEGELYSGALLYEYGFFEDFSLHTERVTAQLKEAGVEKIIALTPHSAEIFREIYPHFVPHFDIEVSPYVITLAGALKYSGRELSLPQPLVLTLQDPCHLARTLKVTREPREVLAAVGNLEMRETPCHGEATVCCGAPCEIIYPELSEIVAAKRAEELAATGAEAVVTLCPFCYSNLSRGMRMTGKAMKIVDFIEIVHQALGVEND